MNKTVIYPNTTAGELHDILAHLGAKTVIDTIKALAEDAVEPLDQNYIESNDLKKAPKIFKEDCLIRNNWSVKKTHNFIRGLSPFPGAYVKLERKGVNYICKFFDTNITELDTKENKRMKVTQAGILFPCSDKYLLFKEIQLEGKRRMSFKEFLLGNDIGEFEIHD